MAELKRIAARRRGANRFWAVTEFFRRTGPPWTPANAGFELSRRIDAADRAWSACMKIHAVPGGKTTDFKASVTIWPSPTDRQTVAPEPGSWRKAVQKALTRVGYRGTWTKSPDGVFGDFWKDLPSPAAVRREASLLQSLQLPSSAAAPERKVQNSRRVRRRSARRR